MVGFGASAGLIGIPRYCFVFLYSSRVGGRTLTAWAGAGAGAGGGVNWHCLVSVFSYSVRPSGSCVVFHGDADASEASQQSVATSFDWWGFRPPRFSTYSVIIIIATEAVAQFTIGDPVQYADDILPLTSSAILIRLPVGVTF